MAQAHELGDRADASSIVAHRAAESAVVGRPRIFILSDVRLYREGMSLLLGQVGALDLVGADAPPAAFAGIAKLAPDVVLLEASSDNALSLSRHVRKIASHSKIVAFAVSSVDRDIIAYAEAGISAFVDRDGSPEDVVSAVYQALRGEFFCSPRVTALLLGRVAALSAERAHVADTDVLTEREREIVRLVEQGLSNKEIAGHLRLGIATVKNHVHNILEKLRVRRRGEVAARIRQRVREDWLPAAAGIAPANPLDGKAR